MDAVAGPGGIGVLDLQGGVQEHLDHLRRVGVAARPVKRAADLVGLAGLIIPGGESTCLARLLSIFGLDAAIRQAYDQGLKHLKLPRALAASFVVSLFCIGIALLCLRYLKPKHR